MSSVLGHRSSTASNFVRSNSDDMVLEIPDVFPTEDRLHSLEGMHDIIRGHVPENRYSSNLRTKMVGWLRLAAATGDLPAYTDPALSVEEQIDINRNYRDTFTAPIEVRHSWIIARKAINLPKSVQKIYYDHVGMYEGVSQQPTQWPIESALAFTGRIAVKDGGIDRLKNVQGMHFRSGQLRGWARILGSRY